MKELNPLSLKTLLNESLIQEEHEDESNFIPGQLELDPDMTIGSAPEWKDTQILEQMKDFGNSVRGRVSDRIFAIAKRELKAKYSKTGIDVKAHAKDISSEGSLEYTEDDFISEGDEFYDVSAKLFRAFLEGLENSAPFPFLD